MQLLDDFSHLAVDVRVFLPVNDRTTVHPCITGASAGALELEQLAIAQVRQVHHLGRIGSTFFIDAVLDAEQDPAALVERSTVGAAGSLSSADVCLPKLSLLFPETLVRKIWIPTGP